MIVTVIANVEKGMDAQQTHSDGFSQPTFLFSIMRVSRRRRRKAKADLYLVLDYGAITTKKRLARLSISTGSHPRKLLSFDQFYLYKIGQPNPEQKR